MRGWMLVNGAIVVASVFAAPWFSHTSCAICASVSSLLFVLCIASWSLRDQA